MAYEEIKLQNQICFRLYTAARLITQAYEPFLRPLGITYTQYLVLMVLWETDELPVNDIGKRLLLGVNTMSPLIKRMEAMGLLARRESATDKRQQIVFLTPKGKALEHQAATIPSCMVNNLQSCNIKTEQLTDIAPILDELIFNLSAKESKQGAE